LSEPAFDELLRRLAAAEVEFVVVGGLAVNAWGVVRGTKDVDIVVDPDIENLKLVAEVAVETDLGRLDVVQGLEGVPSYEKLRSRSGEAKILGVTVAVCSLDDLKSMKRTAGRTRDLADIEDLEAAGS
jgi:hypothetical protein